MARTVIDLDEEMLAFAQQQLGTKTKRDTINQALTIAVGVTADDRARELAWLQNNAEHIIDFDVLSSASSWCRCAPSATMSRSLPYFVEPLAGVRRLTFRGGTSSLSSGTSSPSATIVVRR